jgi:hypothetical protein
MKVYPQPYASRRKSILPEHSIRPCAIIATLSPISSASWGEFFADFFFRFFRGFNFLSYYVDDNNDRWILAAVPGEVCVLSCGRGLCLIDFNQLQTGPGIYCWGGAWQQGLLESAPLPLLWSVPPGRAYRACCATGVFLLFFIASMAMSFPCPRLVGRNVCGVRAPCEFLHGDGSTAGESANRGPAAASTPSYALALPTSSTAASPSFPLATTRFVRKKTAFDPRFRFVGRPRSGTRRVLHSPPWRSLGDNLIIRY